MAWEHPRVEGQKVEHHWALEGVQIQSSGAHSPVVGRDQRERLMGEDQMVHQMEVVEGCRLGRQNLRLRWGKVVALHQREEGQWELGRLGKVGQSHQVVHLEEHHPEIGKMQGRQRPARRRCG